MFKRGKGKYNSSVNLEDYYTWYKANYSDPLPKPLFKEIFREYIEKMMTEIIYNSSDITLPFNMGTIRVIDLPYTIKLDENGNVDKRRLAPDWGKTLKKWKKLYADVDSSEWASIKNKPIIYLENDHTDGTLKKWFWDKRMCRFFARNYYFFDATRAWDRLLAKVNKEHNITYYGT